MQLDSPSGGAPLVFPPAALSVYELTPIDTVLLRPIELALPIPAGQEVVVFVTAKGEHRTLPSVATGGSVRVSITNFDFNMRIQLNLIGKIGDKLKVTTNYNTEASFDWENQVKLDEILRNQKTLMANQEKILATQDRLLAK